MMINYFKPRKFLSFSSHSYDIGNPIGFWYKYNDNHFLNIIYAISENCFAGYYNYHLEYTLKNNICNEEAFFVRVWEVVEDRIKNLKAKDPYSTYHDRYIFRIEKLQQFQRYLNSIDHWNARPAYVVIAEKDEIIQKQKKKIEEYEARWNKFKVYEVSQKIRIDEGHLVTLIDLFKQIETLELPSGRKLMKSDHQIVFPRMISKYFAHAGDDIPVETSRNYYVVKKGDIAGKGTSIHPEQRLFKIISVNDDKK